MDWLYYKAKVTFTYGVELRGTKNDKYGFILPADQIIPTGNEIQAGLQALWTYVAEQVKTTAL